MLPGIELINHAEYSDNRGNFKELWKSTDSMRGSYRQLNTATSFNNVLRGMHRQDQTKLVMPAYGCIYDVVLDPKSRKWFGITLGPSMALLVPPEYAHGYLVLSSLAVVQYIVDAPYDKDKEETFKWDSYGIDWPISDMPILSDKDSK